MNYRFLRLPGSPLGRDVSTEHTSLVPVLVGEGHDQGVLVVEQFRLGCHFILHSLKKLVDVVILVEQYVMTNALGDFIWFELAAHYRSNSTAAESATDNITNSSYHRDENIVAPLAVGLQLVASLHCSG